MCGRSWWGPLEEGASGVGEVRVSSFSLPFKCRLFFSSRLGSLSGLGALGVQSVTAVRTPSRAGRFFLSQRYKYGEAHGQAGHDAVIIGCCVPSE